jgi:hypothetical protein
MDQWQEATVQLRPTIPTGQALGAPRQACRLTHDLEGKLNPSSPLTRVRQLHGGVRACTRCGGIAMPISAILKQAKVEYTKQ